MDKGVSGFVPKGRNDSSLAVYCQEWRPGKPIPEGTV
jgi:hypothetical protein